MSSLSRETFRILQINRKNLLIFEIPYRIASGVIYLRLAGAGLRFCLDRAGYSYLTPGNLAGFLLQPWTVLVLLLLAALALVFLMLEIGGLVTIYSGAACSLRPLEAYMGATRKLADIFRRRGAGLFAAAAAWAVLINLFYTARLLSHVRPLGFVSKELSEHYVIRLGLGAGLLLCLLLVLPATFVFHECMLEKKRFREGIAGSRQLLRQNGLRVPMGLLVVQAAVVASAMTFYLAAVTLTVVLVVPFVPDDLELAFLMETVLRIELVITFLAAAGSMTAHFAVVSVLYAGKNRQEPSEEVDFHLNRRRMLGVLGIAALVVTGCLFDAAYNGNYITKSVAVGTTITAHRGSSGHAPENTMAALEAAVEEMADRAEIDVQMTRDGVVVVCHDLRLSRIAGINRRVADMTYEELARVDAGGRLFPEFAGERIPTLEQAMEYAKGRIDLNIELKNLGSGSELPEKVLDLVRQYDMISQCVVTSVNRSYLERLKELEPELRTGYVMSAAYGRPYEDDAIDFISIRSDFVTAGLVEAAHEAGKTVHAWTVNDRMELERLRALEVDDIITDNPILAREVLFREETAETLVQYLRMLLR